MHVAAENKRPIQPFRIIERASIFTYTEVEMQKRLRSLDGMILTYLLAANGVF